MIDCNYNLVAYEYFKGQYTPKEIYPSGERDESKLIDKYSFNNNSMAVLILEDDIVNSDGYGLKKGFYNVSPDKYMDYLLIFQTGKLKAKVPVAKMNVLETANPVQQKVKKMSKNAYKRFQEKELRKYYKGENPDEVDYKTAEIKYTNEKNTRLLIYNSKNIELIGILKF